MVYLIRLLPLALLLPLACNSSDSEQSSGARYESNNRPPEGGREWWDRVCERCHTKRELEGRSAAQIRKAMDDVNSMKRYQSQISDEDLDELVKLLAPSASASGGYRYRASNECRRCHRSQFEEWEHSLHALSHSEVVYDRYFIRASIETGQEIETFCATCHTPLGVHNKTIPFAEAPRNPGDTKVPAVEAEGVQCEFCHTITGHSEVKNGGYVLRPSSTLLGPLEDASSTFHEIETSSYYRQAEYCGTCHAVTHPTNGIVLEATYNEWREGPYASEGVVCQDCHMTEGMTKRVERPGLAGRDGPRRDHISHHTCLGPNILFANTEEHREQRERSLELMRRAAKLDVGTLLRRDGKILLPLSVTNVGAGHYLPTGVTEIREMWLDVEVRDAANEKQLILRSGNLDAEGNISKGAIVYRTEVRDKQGNITTKFWNAVEKVRDHRVPPRETVTDHLELPAEGVTGVKALRVKAALRYRSVSPAGLAEVDAAGVVEIPVLTLAELEKTISL